MNTGTAAFRDGTPIEISSGVAYVRFTYRKEATNVQIEFGKIATEYEEFVGVTALKNELMNLAHPKDYMLSINPWHGKRLVVDGDSITHDQGGYNYWQFVAAELNGMYVDTTDLESQYANGWKGVGGSRIANESNADNPMYSIVLRYQNLPDDADLVIIAAGTNDWAHSHVDLGDFDSDDTTTFNGALNTLLPGLKLKYKYIPVVMMTPIKRGTVYNKQNEKGLTQEDFVEAMIAKCRQYGVYCLDMYSNCPLNPQIQELNETFFLPSKDSDGNIRYDDSGNVIYDATHPNTEGHKIMGKTVAGFIRTLS
jgi:lysophospholipase L1-like esterase